MEPHYDTFKQTTQNFINRHQPSNDESHRCPTPSPVLVARFLIRTVIPLVLGLASGILVEWGERKAGMHSNNALIEVSDFTSCVTTLFIAYTIDALLNHCWPATPDSQTDFFQMPSDAQHTSALILENGLKSA